MTALLDTYLRRFAPLFAPMALLAHTAACGDANAPLPEGQPDASPIDIGDVTYYSDVYTILQTRCAGCHTEGGIAPFSLDETPDTAQSLAARIAQVATEGTMPPFLPGGQSPALRDDMRLSATELATLQAWADSGAPLGDEADKPAKPEPPRFPLTNPDLSFDIGADYTPDASVADDYRCFAVPLDVPAQRMSVGYRIIPGSTKVVHHVIVSLASIDDYPALQALDAETPDRAGWPCFSGPVPDRRAIPIIGTLGSWTPGQDGRQMYPGTGSRVPANVVAIVSMHYNTANGVEPDRTRAEIFFEPEATQDQLLPVAAVRTASRDIDIPAGQADVVVSRSNTASGWGGGLFYRDGDAYALGVTAHGHLLMTKFRITINKGTANEKVLLDIPNWDFHWQGQWLFQEPIRITADDMVTVDCTYDNTSEHRASVGLDPMPQNVTWGEGTTDEMCIGAVMVVDSMPAAQ